MLDLTAFRYAPPSTLGRTQAAAGSVYIGLLGRFYLLDEGLLDPYLDLGIGGGALGTSYDDEALGLRYEETGAGPAVHLGAGLDVFLGPRLRLGPTISVTSVFVDKIRRCRSDGRGECADLPKDDQGYLGGYMNLGVRLVIMLGNEH